MCADFDAFLAEIGMTHEQMAEAKAAMPEPRSCDEDIRHVVALSPIDGLGVFAAESHAGRLAKLWQDGEWYTAGRYINHSPEPSAVAVNENGVLMACGDIVTGQEITLDYRQVRMVWESCHV